jgi:hypothetical protein
LFVLHSSTLARRFRVGLLLVYAFLCLTSVVTGLGFHYYPPVGFLQPLELSFARFAHSVANPSLSEVLVCADYLMMVAFGVGIFVSLILVGLLMFVFVVLGWIVAGIYQATGGSLLGSILLYCVIGLMIAVGLRRHWPAVMEGVAWILVGVEGIWKLFVPQRIPAMAYASARAGNQFRSQGEFAMARNHDDDSVEIQKALPHETVLSSIPTRPVGILNAFTHKIKSQATARALKERAEMIRSANEVARETLTSHELETKGIIAPDKRQVAMTQQELEVLQKKDELADYKAQRAEKVKQPTNPIEREYETQYKPLQAGELRKPLHDATTRAQMMLQAAAERKKLEMEIDANTFYSPEEKAALKQKIRKQFQDLLGEE